MSRKCTDAVQRAKAHRVSIRTVKCYHHFRMPTYQEILRSQRHRLRAQACLEEKKGCSIFANGKALRQPLRFCEKTIVRKYCVILRSLFKRISVSNRWIMDVYGRCPEKTYNQETGSSKILLIQCSGKDTNTVDDLASHIILFSDFLQRIPENAKQMVHSLVHSGIDN